MQIDNLRWDDLIIDKLSAKHNVEVWEVEDIFRNTPKFRFQARGHRTGEDLYSASGRTDDGRYLVVYFIYKPPHENRPLREGLIVSARDMTKQERKQYDRK